MKSLIYINSFIFRLVLFSTLLTVGLLSCSDELDKGKDSLINGEEVTITLHFPEYIETKINTRDFSSSDQINIVYYDNDKKYLNSTTVTPSSFTAKDVKLTLQKLENSKYIHFIVNSNITESERNPENIVLTSPANNVLWGYTDLDGLNSNSQISLYHPIAKVRVENKVDKGFALTSYHIYGVNDKGYLAPKDWAFSSTEMNIPDGASRSGSPVDDTNFTVSKDDNSDEINVFETSNTGENQDKVRVILKGNYVGKEYYYPIYFAERTKNENGTGYSEDPEGYISLVFKDIVRHHKYTLSITEVRAEGWETLEDALNAKPDNRLAVTITDENSDIKNIIACKDYALGVEDEELSVGGDKTEFKFKIVHTYTNSDNEYPQPSISYELISDQDNSWITSQSFDGDAQTCDAQYLGTEDSKTSTGKLFTAVLSLKQNGDAINSRQAKITVKVGDLARTITLTQEARDYLRGEDRTVILEIPAYGNNSISTTIDDYFAWIDQNQVIDNQMVNEGKICYGVRPEDNRQAVRNKGLIFPPVSLYGSNSYVYKIKYKTGDPTTITAPAGYSVTQNGDYWEVKQTNPSSDLGISDQTFVITNSSGNITYHIYTCGFFHELTEEMIAGLARPNESVSPGWYYYEFMQKGNQYILDRNIGSPNNSPYLTTYLNYIDNGSAVGGYFKIATKRFVMNSTVDKSIRFWEMRYYNEDNIAKNLNLNLGNLHVPTKGDMEELEIQLALGSKVAMVSGIGLVDNNRIYIPHGGYYEGESIKLQTRANLWTSTIYCDAQGFFPTTGLDNYNNQNFGFWYYYLDGQPKEGYGHVITQIRSCDATADDFSDASLYHYMPLRLVYGTPNATAERAEDYRKYRIYWPKNCGPGFNLWTVNGFNNDVPEEDRNDGDKIFNFSKKRGEDHEIGNYYYYDFESADPLTTTFNFNFSALPNGGNSKDCNPRNLKIEDCFSPVEYKGEEIWVGYATADGNNDPNGITKGLPFTVNYNSNIQLYWKNDLKVDGHTLKFFSIWQGDTYNRNDFPDIDNPQGQDSNYGKTGYFGYMFSYLGVATNEFKVILSETKTGLNSSNIITLSVLDPKTQYTPRTAAPNLDLWTFYIDEEDL